MSRRPGWAHSEENVAQTGQWAKVPEWVAYKGLDAMAWNVLIILAAKAGRERVTWISHRTIGDGLGVHRTTVGRAVRKLTKVGVIEDAGKVVVNREAGTWVKRYRIVDRSPDLPEVHPGRTSGAHIAPTEVHLEGPQVHLEGPEVHPGRTHSVPQYSVPHRSVDARFENEEDPNPNGRTKPAAKKEPATHVRVFTEKIGAYSRFDPDNPKDRATLCVVPGCGKYNHRRTYCSTHDLAEVMPFIEKAAAGENR